jgi:dTDP-glucose 4,6-dehydratase
MKILIYGHAGWIGSQFISLLYKNNINHVLGNSRVDDTPSLIQELDYISPSHVISFIGRTHGIINDKIYPTIDYLEQPGKLSENVRDNLFSPLSLALECKVRNIHYTYLGTGCIFNYAGAEKTVTETDTTETDTASIFKNEHKFNEDDIPNFFGSSYSIVKGFTDRLMHQLSDCTLNLRIRMPIVAEENPRNFITKILSYSKICSVPNSMSVLDELLPIVIKMMQAGLVGTVNLTNPGVISHNEILEMYQKHVDPSFTWNNFSIEEQRKILMCDRSNNWLDTTVLEKFSPEVRCIKDAIEDTIKNYNCNKTRHCVNNITDKYIMTNKTSEYPNKIQNKYNMNQDDPFIYSPNKYSNFIGDIDNNKLKSNSVIFVTGGAGFIGSHFINNIYFKHHGVKIINFDALYYCANEEVNIKKEIRENKNRYTFIKGNLQSIDLLNYIFKTNVITHIIHFAAQTHVQTSFTDALMYTQDNIVGTHNLLEASRKYCQSLAKFIHVSTDEVYGENENLNIKTEKSILCPTNPYAATKASAELLAQAYYHSFKMPIIITRGNNVYGPNQYPEKVIPKFINLLTKNMKVTMQDESCRRAFLHAYDAAMAFITIIECGKIGEIYNIGCDENMEYSILEVAKLLIKKIKNSENYSEYIEYIEDRPFNDKRYYISNIKLKALGWKITVDFEKGIDELIMLDRAKQDFL